jgi:hypothetical protein
VLGTHAYNPSYSGDRDQEDRSSKPGQIVRETLSQKKPITKKKRAGGVAQDIDPEIIPL